MVGKWRELAAKTPLRHILVVRINIDASRIYFLKKFSAADFVA